MRLKKIGQSPWFWCLLLRVFLVSWLGLEVEHAFADTDLLAGSLGDMKATLGGSGRKVMYLIEGISALIGYRATKNIYILGSILAVALFINVLLAFVG